MTVLLLQNRHYLIGKLNELKCIICCEHCSLFILSKLFLFRTWSKNSAQNNSPPPLPPKRRSGHHNTKNNLCNLSLEPLCLSDRSSSIGSLDSVLNDDEVNVAMCNDDNSFLTSKSTALTIIIINLILKLIV